MSFWPSLWTFTWYAGLSAFALLSVLVIIFGARDLVHLFRSLRDKHSE